MKMLVIIQLKENKHNDNKPNDALHKQYIFIPTLAPIPR